LRWLVLGSVVVGCAGSAGAEAWRFAVLSDTHVGSNGIFLKRLTHLAESLARERIDVLLVTGDLVLDGTRFDKRLDAWREALQPVYDAGVKVLPIRGNHDDSDRPDIWRRHFSYLPQNGPAGQQGLTYALAHKNALFIGLDQYVNRHRIQQPWLDSVLAANHQPHVFVFGHEPAFSSRHQNTLAKFPAARDTFWNSLGAAGVRMYFCGHDHFFGRADVPDARGNLIQQVISGTGSAGVRGFSRYEDKRATALVHEDSDRGYIIVEVDGGAATVQWKALQDSRKRPQVFLARDTFRYTVPMPALVRAPVAAGMMTHTP
jgi:3',5'-cyclic AMP phosphodiesterase CpdA